MKNQFAKIVAVLMVLAMAVSCFGLCASAAEADVVLLGDVNLNGVVTISDATLIQKELAKLATLDEVQTAAADATEDGEVNIKDTTMIQKWLAKFEDANQNIGQPIDFGGASDDEPATKDEATKDEATKDEATKDEATTDEATKDEATTDEATKDEATTDEATKDEATKDEPAVDPEVPVDPEDPEVPVDPATKDEATTDEATKDEATTDEATADEVYYLVGYINGNDYYGTDYAFVNGTVTVVFEAESYVIVQDATGATFMTDGWLGFNPTSAVLSTSYAKGDKFHVAAGTATFTWDAATCTLTLA